MQQDSLRTIKTFSQLIAYLRDELDWPIEPDNFEDLTFDYDPEELGIEPEAAAKIEEIKQLRPLVTAQLWGIFFIKFEPKYLPVVVLRRILSQLVSKKRTSAKKSEQATWHLHDLLFISNYGVGDQRQITFAHFTQDENMGNLPTLKVLGWDDADTVLHMDHIHHVLKENLIWPDNEGDFESWRRQWSSCFVLRHREVITTSKALAVRLAELAKRMRTRARVVLSIESKNGPLRQLHKAFQETLIHDLNEDDFSDMYAQTITYGLFSAACSRPMGIIADNLADMVPVTNPFLKEMLGTFLSVSGRKSHIDFDELGVQEVVDLLNNPDTHLEAVLRDFGNRTRQEDPVVHFYELFLNEYDKKKKVQRGVFYTPQPVVSYIVRSVHELLQTEFGIEEGLASTITWGEMIEKHPDIKLPVIKTKNPRDPSSQEILLSPQEPFVQILDPATGTATFLVEAIDIIYKTMRDKWLKAGHKETEIYKLWNDYVPKDLLPRLYGFELMMAPYAIAHMKLGLKLFETGYKFQSDERARVYLTNTLEPPGNIQLVLKDISPALAREAEGVNAIKLHQRFTVVIGNPPYSGLSANMTKSASAIIEPYKFISGVHFGEKKHWLHDDYVKFVRIGETIINAAGVGVLGLITNHAFYDNPTFRGMRWNLLYSFAHIQLLDLHGNTMRREVNPNGGVDKNVFDIQQGVAISIFCKIPRQAERVVLFGDLWGTRENKYISLTRETTTVFCKLKISPVAEFYFFIPRLDANIAEYQRWPSLNDIFSIFSGGFITARDHLVVDFNRETLISRIKEFVSENYTDATIRKKYFSGKGSEKYEEGDTRGWKLATARSRIREDNRWLQHLRMCLYRPFDVRWIYWVDCMVDWPRPEVSRHLLNEGNIGLVFMRQVASGDSYSHFLVSRHPVDNRACYSNKGIMSLAPLYLYETTEQQGGKMKFDGSGRYSNFTPAFLQLVQDVFGQAITLCPTPEEIFHYAYGLFNSSVYRNRYAEFLKIDFPRLPLTSSMDLFRALAKLGGELITFHLMESSKLDRPITKWKGSTPSILVEKVTYFSNTVYINKAQTECFQNVPENVWTFQIGGYQVCEKWLKDRKGRSLSAADIAHYQKIIVAFNETIRLMKEIDEVIDQHGGWPGAFA